MITDVSFFREFWDIERITDYFELLVKMSEFDFNFFKKFQIATEEHPYKDEILYLPPSIHFRAHILRAREDTSVIEKTRDYSEAVQIANRHPFIKGSSLKDDYIEAVICYQKFSKGTYVAQNGVRGANRRIRKLSQSMSRPFPNRRAAIKQYAQNRPIEHNLSISKAKTRMVIDLQNGMTYQSVNEIAALLQLSPCTIRRYCRIGKNYKYL
jgi:hypothetical protein